MAEPMDISPTTSTTNATLVPEFPSDFATTMHSNHLASMNNILMTPTDPNYVQNGHQPHSESDQNNSQHTLQETFDRQSDPMPQSALDRATAAKYRLEHYYKFALELAIERNQ
ncbi:hypothetical protein BC938DRAFT_474907, partial [Jimgerdemannia flammicorona]